MVAIKLAYPRITSVHKTACDKLELSWVLSWVMNVKILVAKISLLVLFIIKSYVIVINQN